MSRSLIMRDTSCIQEDWSLVKIIQECPPNNWRNLFENIQTLIAHCDRIINKSKAIVPLRRDIFNCYHYTALDLVKVVIVVQDPYTGYHHDGLPIATGLALSIRSGYELQPSLVNVYREIQKDYPNFSNYETGDLSRWAYQGVLLLNMALTAIPGRTDNPHTGIWRALVIRTVKLIRKERPKAGFLLWGKAAQELQSEIRGAYCLMAAHPSPKSYNHGFRDCHHFSSINSYLESTGQTPIEW